MMGILLTKIQVAIFQKYKGANHGDFRKGTNDTNKMEMTNAGTTKSIFTSSHNGRY